MLFDTLEKDTVGLRIYYYRCQQDDGHPAFAKAFLWGRYLMEEVGIDFSRNYRLGISIFVSNLDHCDDTESYQRSDIAAFLFFVLS